MRFDIAMFYAGITPIMIYAARRHIIRVASAISRRALPLMPFYTPRLMPPRALDICCRRRRRLNAIIATRFFFFFFHVLRDAAS